MKDALIGYTGFVGSNLNAQHEFSDKYNSKNINDIAGKEYDLVVCAGARAEKWKINQDPETDLRDIDSLKKAIGTIRAKNFILISTVDVYLNPVNVDESTIISTDNLQPYGLHRLRLEEFVRSKFDNALIVRLPGLFGPGLKKNVIYDLLTNNAPFLEQTNSDSRFQYYNLANVWKDISIALEAGVDLINFATEPVSTEDVAKHAFDIDFINHPESKPAGLYDFKTVHEKLYGGTGGYIYSGEQILADMAEFVKNQRELPNV